VRTRTEFSKRALLLGLVLCSSIVLLSSTAPTRAEGEAEHIDRYVSRWHEVGRFNGVVLVAKDGKTVLSKGYGEANMEWNIPNAPDTKFKLHSISKQFTTVLVLQLAAEGRIDLDGRLTDYLPDYRKDTGDRVTIDQLLRHTAGIPCYINDSHRRPQGRPVYRWGGHYGRDEFVRDFLSDDFLFEPGSNYKYSNTGYYLLALVVEAVTGKTYDENLAERIFDPLGMKNSGVDRHSRVLVKRADGYRKAPGGYVNVAYENPDNLLGAGNIYSTVEDLLVWNLALETDAVLPKEWREKMFTPYWKEPRQEHAYSLNYFTYRRASGEEVRFTGFSGGGPGFNTDALRFPETGVIVVILDNSTQYNHWRMGPAIDEIMSGGDPRMPRPLVSDALVETLVEGGLQAALRLREDIEHNRRDDFDRSSVEQEINSYGYGALGRGDVNLAIEIFKLNVALFPNSWNVYDSLGEGYLAAGETALSQENYATSRELRNRENTIMEHIRSGAFEEARRLIDRAHESDSSLRLLTPARIGPYFEEVVASGDYDRALELCRVWAAANPDTPGPYFSMARVYEAKEDAENTKSCYRTIIEMEPEGRAAETARKRLENAE
jgi:CubicO group peptidase (beta-lactamase class C family)